MNIRAVAARQTIEIETPTYPMTPSAIPVALFTYTSDIHTVSSACALYMYT